MALYGNWTVPPGDVAVVGIVSVSRQEANGRLRTIEQILQVLGYSKVRESPGEKEYQKRGGEIEISRNGQPVLFRVHAATVGGVVGFTAIVVICDEVARWYDKDSATNPAAEVIASLKPCMATVPTAVLWLISSPWSTLDAHAEAFARGDIPGQIVAHAPTWIANPTLTEADCEALEQDEETRDREYGANPMSSEGSAIFDATLIDRAVAKARPVVEGFVAFGGDFGFRKNSSALVGVRTDGERFGVCHVEEKKPKPGQPLIPSEVIGKFANVVRSFGADSVMCDWHYSETVAEELDPFDLARVPAPDTQTKIAASFVRFRVLLTGDRVALPNHAKLLRQLKEARQKPTANGGITIEHPRRGSEHGDIAAACVLAVWHADHSEAPDEHRPRFRSRSEGFDPRYETSRPGEMREYPDHSRDGL